MQLGAACHQIDLAGCLLASLDDFQIPNDGLSLLHGQFSCSLIGNPTMHTSSTRIDPEQVLEPKIFSQHTVNDLDGNGHEFPALSADITTATTRSDFIVICHINIKHQFTLQGLELGCSKHLFVLGLDVVDSTQIDLVRIQTQQVCLEFLGIGIRLETNVGIRSQSE